LAINETKNDDLKSLVSGWIKTNVLKTTANLKGE
jgi:hypothetical protein